MNRRGFFKSGVFSTCLLGMGEVIKGSDILQEPMQMDIDHAVNSYDVIVCGGGPAGFAAALSAARSGARTALIEVQGCLGGIWTAGLLCNIIDYKNKEGIMKEIMNNLDNYNSQRIPKRYDPEIMKLVLEEIAMNAGVNIRLHTRVTNAHVNCDNRLTSIVTQSKSGLEKWKATVFIDCTGDGDLAALAGEAYEIGHPVSGKTQPMSYIAVLSGLNSAELIEKDLVITFPVKNTYGSPKDNFAAEIERAGINCSYSRPTLFEIRDNLIGMMANHQYNASALDAGDITKATLEGRKEVHAIVNALKNLGGVWKDIFITQTPEHIGVREGRRIAGIYSLTVDDLLQGARFEDAVCRVTFPVDVHSLDAEGHKGFSNDGVKSIPYDIPLRSLIAKNIKGLMMAGRCISGDFYAHASYRVTGNAVPMGEAAGKCAAWAAKHNLMPYKVPYGKLSIQSANE